MSVEPRAAASAASDGGQVANLREFVLSACAMELGLENEKHSQAPNPLDPRKKPTGNDLNVGTVRRDDRVCGVAAGPVAARTGQCG